MLRIKRALDRHLSPMSGVRATDADADAEGHHE